MAAQSKHNGDILLWVHKVIDSCTTPLQVISARKVVRQFTKKIVKDNPNINYKEYSEIVHGLQDKLEQHKTPELHSPQGKRYENEITQEA